MKLSRFKHLFNNPNIVPIANLSLLVIVPKTTALISCFLVIILLL